MPDPGGQGVFLSEAGEKGFCRLRLFAPGAIVEQAAGSRYVPRMANPHPLDRVAWRALTGPQSALASGTVILVP